MLQDRLAVGHFVQLFLVGFSSHGKVPRYAGLWMEIAVSHGWIVLACAVWGPVFKGWQITVYCDNTGAVALVKSGYSRVSQIMHLLRCLFFFKACYHFPCMQHM